MSIIPGLAARARGLFSDNKGPWGPSGGDGDGGGEPPSGGPWSEPPRKRRPGNRPEATVTSLDELLRRGRSRFGGGGGLPGRPDGSVIRWAVIAVILVWLLFTTFHQIAPEERGVVTRFGRYSHTLGPGVTMTLPWPVDRVQKVNVEQIRAVDLGSTAEETLMLTGDQNIIDIAYQVRWNIRDPEQYLFELATPEDTIRQVAESSMRMIVGQVSLQDAIGNRRGDIEARVAEEMQQTLDAYQAGVVIQGVAIKQADPPAAVNDAFKDVTAAQQDAQSYINAANAYSQQLRQKAQGEATAFDKVYEQYRLAPDVTRRRMYYETMEQVLQKVDKTIIEAPGVTPYLPLPEVQKRSTPQRSGQ
ncbi:MAG TPA: FtsH protease activity modulator HflK [Sphingomicrobium sp.]